MSAWEDISSTYAEAATKALPLHRAIVFGAGFLLSLSIQQQTHLSILETLAVVPLSDFSTLDKGFLAKATGANVMWAMLATLTAVALSKGMIRLAYGVVDRATGASKRAAQLDRGWVAGLPIEERKAALDLVESGLAESRTRLRAMTGMNEILIGVSAMFAVSAVWGNALDGSISAVTLIAATCTHLMAIYVFLTDYYGPALAKAQLQGRSLPRITSLD